MVETEEASIRAFAALSSTGGSGGVLDIFYDEWKMKLACDPSLFAITTQLWKAAYCHAGEAQESLSKDDQHRWHPFGAIDPSKGYVYIDRIGYRLPTELSTKLGNTINGHKKKKLRPLQRSLTPHLDCCPESMYSNISKWRPIQCFVALTDTMQPNTGGFEAAPGFHRTFDDWTKNRQPTTVAQNGITKEVSPPCVGAYTHIRPQEDADVMKQVTHVSVPAGSVVFWDNRIPHANAYRHDGLSPRVVVYCSLLPDLELNRSYVRKQLQDWTSGVPPRDQWNNIQQDDQVLSAGTGMDSLTPLGRKLMGVDDWESTHDKY